ncbi:DUF2934 domain-containing protein [Azospirillum soli]|uniref:DUF2934 domain-containing protein n=1 Tax=Azospirillum soli TaxID=1304799 RepID=UPI001AE2C53C|nr:DUF2934 domain-containing protein [Azospirillum soli]MBP2315646.1 hypothetical protein [Azospirillum soli]
MQGDREERIRRRAHEIWEREGRPEGQHDAHWARACAEIDDEDRAGEASATNVVKKVVRRTKKAAADAIGAGMNAVVDVVEEALGQKKPRGRKAKAEAADEKTSVAKESPKESAKSRKLPAVTAGSRAVAKTEDMDMKPAAAKPTRGKGAKAANDTSAGDKPAGAKTRRKSGAGQNSPVVH